MSQPTHSQSNGQESDPAEDSLATAAADSLLRTLPSGTPGRILNIASYLILLLGIGTTAAAAYPYACCLHYTSYWNEWIVIAPFAGLNSNLPLNIKELRFPVENRTAECKNCD